MVERKWEDEIRRVPGYEVEWYIVYEISETNIEVLDSYNIGVDVIEKLRPTMANVIHDLRTISEKELKGVPIDKRKLDTVIKAQNGYISMSLISDNIMVIAGLKRK